MGGLGRAALRNLHWLLLVGGLVALNLAAVTVDEVNGRLSDILAQVTGTKTLSAQAHDRARRAEVALAEVKATLAATRTELGEVKAALASETAALVTAKAQAAGIAGRDARRGRLVSDTAAALSTKAKLAAARNAGTVFAQSIPWFGIEATTAAAAADIADLCAIMRGLSELSRQIETGDRPDPDMEEVCALKTATRDEIWPLLNENPDAAWQAARALGVELPDVAFGGATEFVMDTIGGLSSFLEQEASPTPPEDGG